MRDNNKSGKNAGRNDERRAFPAMNVIQKTTQNLSFTIKFPICYGGNFSVLRKSNLSCHFAIFSISN